MIRVIIRPDCGFWTTMKFYCSRLNYQEITLFFNLALTRERAMTTHQFRQVYTSVTKESMTNEIDENRKNDKNKDTN